MKNKLRHLTQLFKRNGSIQASSINYAPQINQANQAGTSSYTSHTSKSSQAFNPALQSKLTTNTRQSMVIQNGVERPAIANIEATLNDLIKARPNKGSLDAIPSGRVSTQQWGTYQSAFKGRGMEFAESRVYQAGDDVKSIDWRTTARTGTAHTKLYQEERERPVQLLVDMRSMMRFGTRHCFKSYMVANISAQLAWLAHDGGDRVGGQILTSSGIKDFRGARTRKAVLRLLEAISQQTFLSSSPSPRFMTEPSLASGLHRVRKTARPGTLIFILSDFNDFDALAKKELVRLSAHAYVTLIQINDPLDMALPEGAGKISDGQSAIDLSAVSPAQLDSYADAYLARQQRIDKTCAQHGIAIRKLMTSDDLKYTLNQPKASNKPPKKEHRHKQPAQAVQSFGAAI